MKRPPPKWRARLGRGLMLVVLAVVLVLLVRYARSTDWAEVGQALRGYGAARIAGCLGLVALSYLLYCGYELLSRWQVGLALPPLRTAAIGLVSYAVSLNLGALVGGGVRLRLYGREGVPTSQVVHISLFAVATNWLGYCALAGMGLASGLLVMPARAGSPVLWRALGVVMVALILAYLVACARWSGRRLQVRGRTLEVPRLRMAALQLLLSSLNWAILGALLFLLLPKGVGYPRVLAVVLVAALIGVVLHTPAGLGAWESALMFTLGRELGQSAVVAALLAYRGLYYGVPLGVGLLVHTLLEAAGPRAQAKTTAPAKKAMGSAGQGKIGPDARR